MDKVQNTKLCLTRENADMIVGRRLLAFRIESNPLFGPKANPSDAALSLALMDGYPVCWFAWCDGAGISIRDYLVRESRHKKHAGNSSLERVGH